MCEGHNSMRVTTTFECVYERVKHTNTAAIDFMVSEKYFAGEFHICQNGKLRMGLLIHRNCCADPF